MMTQFTYHIPTSGKTAFVQYTMMAMTFSWSEMHYLSIVFLCTIPMSYNTVLAQFVLLCDTDYISVFGNNMAIRISQKMFTPIS